MSIRRLQAGEHGEVLHVGRLELRVQMVDERGEEQVSYIDTRVRTQVPAAERSGGVRQRFIDA